MHYHSSAKKIYIPIQEVSEIVSLSASSIRRLETEGKFPAKRMLSARRVGYVLSEVQEWAENRDRA